MSDPFSFEQANNAEWPMPAFSKIAKYTKLMHRLFYELHTEIYDEN